MFRKILIANDGSEGAKKALKVAIDLAKRYQAELHSISVEEHLPHYAATVGEVVEARAEADDYFKKITEAAESQAVQQGVSLHTHVLPGHEVEVVVNIAKEKGFDLLVIGFMGHSKIFGRIWGSTSQNLTRLAPCTVLVVK
jgi:nucleotide-binding universal stress UspA family protein